MHVRTAIIYKDDEIEWDLWARDTQAAFVDAQASSAWATADRNLSYSRS